MYVCIYICSYINIYIILVCVYTNAYAHTHICALKIVFKLGCCSQRTLTNMGLESS